MELTYETPCYFPRHIDCYSFADNKRLKGIELLIYSLIGTAKEWDFENDETVTATTSVIKNTFRLSAPTVRSTISKLIKFGLLERVGKDEYKVIHWEEAATAGELSKEALEEIAWRESVGGNDE